MNASGLEVIWNLGLHENVGCAPENGTSLFLVRFDLLRWTVPHGL